MLTSMSTSEMSAARVPTGVEGLDQILGGGLPRNRIYLLEGNPGTGKTTIALQFLLEGVRQGERGLYVTLSETKEELREVASSHGWSLDGLEMYDLAVPEREAAADSQYTLFHPSEVELADTTKAVFGEVERVSPQRIVFDSLSEMRLLARDPLRYRRQILALKQFFIGRKCTVLLLDDHTSETSDRQLESLAHGVLMLEHNSPGYGGPRRHLRVLKMRGVNYHGGFHDFSINTGGVVVYPRLVASEHRQEWQRETLASGVPALDDLAGGLDSGTATLIIGPAGSGKSTLSAQYAAAAARRGTRVAIYSFEESPAILLARTRALGIDLAREVQAGLVTVRQVDPAELTAGEFAYHVCRAVEKEGVRLVVIDSINGYHNALPEEDFLTAHLRQLLAFLNQQGVVTLLVMAQHGMLGTTMSLPADVSYIADTVILLRYFEAAGEIRQAISVAKKRSGRHERSIREFRLGPNGIEVGRQLTEFRAILSGQPEYVGKAGDLLGSGSQSDEK
jgi:circadian clock protein KaiC